MNERRPIGGDSCEILPILTRLAEPLRMRSSDAIERDGNEWALLRPQPAAPTGLGAVTRVIGQHLHVERDRRARAQVLNVGPKPRRELGHPHLANERIADRNGEPRRERGEGQIARRARGLARAIQEGIEEDAIERVAADEFVEDVEAALLPERTVHARFEERTDRDRATVRSLAEPLRGDIPPG